MSIERLPGGMAIEAEQETGSYTLRVPLWQPVEKPDGRWALRKVNAGGGGYAETVVSFGAPDEANTLADSLNAELRDAAHRVVRGRVIFAAT